MIVCHCRRVTDRAICQAVQSGARSCGEIGNACGAGTGCGGCRPAIEELVAQEQTSKQFVPLARLAS